MESVRIPISLASKLPPAPEFFVEDPTEGPTMLVVHPTANRARLEINSYLPPENGSPFFMMNTGIPYETDG